MVLSCVIQMVDLQWHRLMFIRHYRKKPGCQGVDDTVKNIFQADDAASTDIYYTSVPLESEINHLVGTRHANQKYLSPDEKNAFPCFSEVGGRSQMKDHRAAAFSTDCSLCTRYAGRPTRTAFLYSSLDIRNVTNYLHRVTAAMNS